MVPEPIKIVYRWPVCDMYAQYAYDNKTGMIVRVYNATLIAHIPHLCLQQKLLAHL